MTSNPPINGHALKDDGKVIPIVTLDPGDEHRYEGGCECGAFPHMTTRPSIHTMREWHREHKNAVREGRYVSDTIETEPAPPPPPPKHTHLDRMVRMEGECPGCDVIWQVQRVRLHGAKAREKANAQLDGVMERERRRHFANPTSLRRNVDAEEFFMTS